MDTVSDRHFDALFGTGRGNAAADAARLSQTEVFAAFLGGEELRDERWHSWRCDSGFTRLDQEGFGQMASRYYFSDICVRVYFIDETPEELLTLAGQLREVKLSRVTFDG